MAEYYLSHMPRLIVAEAPSGDPPKEVEGPLEAEEWIAGWLLTAPANPSDARDIMGGLAKVQNKLPPDTLLLYPYDEASLAEVVVNWIEGLERNPELAAFLGEEVEDNAEAYENLLLGEKTLWQGFKEILGFTPEGKRGLPAVKAYEALLERGLDDFRAVARGGAEDLPPEALHRLSSEAKTLLIKEKRRALVKLVQELAPTWREGPRQTGDQTKPGT